MIIHLKKGASKEENLMWAKTQMAHKAGFRYVPEKGCTCNGERKHADKVKPLTKEDMINGRG